MKVGLFFRVGQGPVTGLSILHLDNGCDAGMKGCCPRDVFDIENKACALCCFFATGKCDLAFWNGAQIFTIST